MADYGLTIEELTTAGGPRSAAASAAAAPTRAPPVVCYRNAAGQSWDGQGDMPDWLRRAVNAGQSVEFLGSGSRGLSSFNNGPVWGRTDLHRRRPAVRGLTCITRQPDAR